MNSDYDSLDYDLRKLIVKNLSVKIKVFPHERGADARELAREQSSRWQSIISDAVDGFAREFPQRSRRLGGQVSAISQCIGQNNGNFFKVIDAGDSYKLIGEIPILEADSIDSDIADKSYIFAAILAETLVPVQRKREHLGGNFDELIIVLPEILILQMITYNADKSGEIDLIYDRFKHLGDEAQNRLTEIRILETESGNIVSGSKNDLEILLNRISQKEEEILSKQQENFKKFIDEGTSKIEAARAASHESATLDSATRIWRSKYTKHTLTFSAVSIMLMAAVVAFFLCCYCSLYRNQKCYSCKKRWRCCLWFYTVTASTCFCRWMGNKNIYKVGCELVGTFRRCRTA